MYAVRDFYSVCCLFVLLLVSLFSIPSFAQTPTKEMDEVEVQATSLESDLSSKLAQYGHRVEVITGEEIEENNIQDVAQALEMLAPGVHVAPKNGRGDYANVSIQGAQQQNVLFMLDGVRFNNRLFATTLILDSISPHMIDRIEILKGGQGIFYGTQGIGGVINIITKSPKSEREGEMAFGAGTLGDRNLSGYVTEEVQGTKLLVFGNSDRSDGYLPFKDSAYETTATKTKRGFDRTNVGLKLSRSFDGNRSLELFAQRNDVDADYARPWNQFQNASNDRDEHIVNLKYNQDVSENVSYFVKGYYHDWWTDFTRVGIDNSGSANVIYDDTLWGYEDYGANAMLSYSPQGPSEWILGTDFQRYYGEDRTFGFEGEWESVYAPYAQYRAEWGATKFSISGRYNVPSSAQEKFIGESSIKQALTKSLSLRLKAGNSFRLPSQFELYGSTGNPNLNPEESRGGEIGFEGQYRLGRMPLTFSADYFHRILEDRIAGSPLRNTDTDVTSKGMDFKLGLRLNRQWSMNVNGTLADATGDGSNQQVTGVPESNFKGKIQYRSRQQGYRLALLGKYVGDQFEEGANRQQFGSHTVIDFTGSFDLDQQGAHSMSFRLENLLDREYTTSIADKTTVSGSTENFRNLGVPRNLMVEYTHSF